MKNDILTRILDTIKAANPGNYYINNGGLAKLGQLLFYPPKGKEKVGHDLLQTIEEAFPETSKEVLDSLKRYHLTSYYTPKEIIGYKIDLLKRNGFEPSHILEPSAGNGAYVQQLKKAFPNARITALEPDILSFEILKANNVKSDNVTVLNIPFEDYYLNYDKQGQFDLVMTNIPFGDIPITKAYRHDYLTEPTLKNVGNYFNVYAPKMVRQGGITALITSSTFAERNAYNDFRQRVLMENDLLLANRFNTDLFSEEGTKVVSDLLVYRRTTNKNVLSKIEIEFVETDTIEIEGQSFMTNQFFKAHTGQVNGSPKLGFFHNRPSMVIEPDGTSLSEFLERQSNNFDFVQIAPPRTTQKIQETVTQASAIDKEEPIVVTVPELEVGPVPIKLQDNDAKQFTRLFFGSYNFDEKGKVFFYTDPHSVRKVPIKITELIRDYARMRNDLVLLNLNINKGRLSIKDLKWSCSSSYRFCAIKVASLSNFLTVFPELSL